MVICGRCNDEVTEAIQCSACHKHFDYPCSGITEKGYRKLGDRQASWRCATCKSAGNPSAQSATNISSPIASPSVTLESLMGELASINLKLAPLSSLTSELQLLRKDVSDLKNFTAEFPARIQVLEDKVSKLEVTQSEVINLKSLVEKLQEEADATNQWLRCNNIEIKGVPIKDKENLFEIAMKIGNQISYPITKSQINFVHRVPSNIAGTKNIIVSLTNKYLKEDFVAAARARKEPLTPNDIGIPGSGRIYVNDHLTTRNKILLSKTKSLAKESNFQFVWVRHMKIFVRRDMTSKSFIINSEKDLQKLHRS